MQPDVLATALNTISTARDSDQYRAIHLSIVGPRKIERAEEIEALLADLETYTGWIARQSGVEVWGGLEREDTGGLGEILAAELALDDHSVQIRRQPGSWVVTEYREGEGKAHIVEDMCHMTVRHGVLKYRRYWSLPEDGASEPVIARLVGIEGVPS